MGLLLSLACGQTHLLQTVDAAAAVIVLTLRSGFLNFHLTILCMWASRYLSHCVYQYQNYVPGHDGKHIAHKNAYTPKWNIYKMRTKIAMDVIKCRFFFIVSYTFLLTIVFSSIASMRRRSVLAVHVF